MDPRCIERLTSIVESGYGLSNAECRELIEDVRKLTRFVLKLSERVQKQSELLSQKAENVNGRHQENCQTI